MTDQLLELHEKNLPAPEHRAAQAEIIKKYVKNFKLCDGCGSICQEIVDICPVCEGYSFDENEENILKQVEIIGCRPRETIISEDLTD